MGVLSSEARHRELEAEVAEVCGILNAAHGRLADLVADAIDEGIWEGWQIQSPGHWLAWKSAMAPAQAHAVARLASRRAELPETFEALRAGTLSLDAGTEIAKRAPAEFEQSIMDCAPGFTINQLRKTLRNFAYPDGTDDPRNKKAHPDRRGVSKGRDDHGHWFKGRLDDDEAAVWDHALTVARDDLIRQAAEACEPGQQPAEVTWADAAVAMAEGFLRSGHAAHPGSDRFLVHLHLDARLHLAGSHLGGSRAGGPHADRAGGAATGAALSFHLGGPIPAVLQSLLLCGGTRLRPTFWDGTRPLSVGRSTRTISRRLKRVIEHRDGGCRVPGCGTTTRLDIHHIEHWEHGGSTNTDNLVCLCRRHHRLHHQNLLGITGNPDLPDTDPDGLSFTDRWHKKMDPGATPTRPEPLPGQNNAGDSTAGTRRAAKNAGIEPTGTFRHPYGENLDPTAVFFSRNRPKPVPPPADQDPHGDHSPTGSAAPKKPTGPWTNNDTTWFGPGGQPRNPGPHDPKHGGPPTSSSPPAA